MSKALILVSRPGFEPPKSYLEKVFENFPTQAGYCTVIGDDKTGYELDLMTLDGNRFNLKESFMGPRSPIPPNKDSGLILTFLDHDKHESSDEQPYPLVFDDKQVFVAAAIDSECEGFTPHADGYTAAHAAVQQFLSEHLLDLYIACDEDLAKVYQELDSAKHRRVIGTALNPVGAITLMLANKDPTKQVLSFTNKLKAPIDAKEFWASRDLGWKAVEAMKEAKIEKQEQIVATANVQETPLQKKQREKREAMAAGGKPASTGPVGEKALPAPGTETTGDKTPQTITKDRFKIIEGIKVPENITVPDGHRLCFFRNGAAQIFPDNIQVMSPPRELVGQGLRQWYMRHYGFAPDNFESQRPALPTHLMKKDAPSRNYITDLLGYVQAWRKPGQTEDEVLAEQEREKERAENIAIAKAGKQDVPLFVPPRAAKDIHKKLETVQPMSKEQMEAAQVKAHKAHEQLGISFEEMLRLDTRTLRDIQHTNGQTLVVMYAQVAAMLAQKMPEVFDYVKPVKEEVKPQTTGLTDAERQKNLKALGEQRIAESHANETPLQRKQREKREAMGQMKATG